METKTKSFINLKTREIEKLFEAISLGEVDLELLPVLFKINLLRNFVTTWSCAGHDNHPANWEGYLSLCSVIPSEIILTEYQKLVRKNSDDKVKFFDQPFIVEIGFAQEDHLTYVFRMGKNVNYHNRSLNLRQFENVYEFLKILDPQYKN